MTGNRVVYGPVSSWRLGRSLGVDLICRGNKKTCSFDCYYCSLGRTNEKILRRRNFIDISTMRKELEESLPRVNPDFITFSGTGDPTLAENLGDSIEVVKELSDFPTAVLTNSALMIKEGVRNDLSKSDEVVASLDAPNEELFEKINRPHPDLSFEGFVNGLREFRSQYEKKLDLEIMFTQENKKFSEEIAEIVESIQPDEVQINTPLRASPVEPLTSEEIEKIKDDFGKINSKSVYSSEKVKVKDVVGEEKLRLLKR